MSERTARRLTIHTEVAGPALRDDMPSRADRLRLLGWVRLMEDGTVCVHAEGAPAAIDKLVAYLRSMPGVQAVTERTVTLEGHEQFAVRGVPAGVFVVQEHQATAHHFDVRLEVDGVMRSWAVPKGPSLDPAVKRFAVEVEDHSLEHNEFEGRSGRGGVIIWDRGHAAFVLHGEKLQGGFALQRTRSGEKPQWLMVKRRDEHARPGSDIAAERPESVRSGRTLAELLEG